MDYFRQMAMVDTSFSNNLIAWYLQNKRDLPWRNTSDPYKVWLSEIILQQTRVAQGLPYYEKFENTYPTVHDLAQATEAEVLKTWQGLGYYSRARNLHVTAKMVSQEMDGIFPQSYKGLLKLKGVGDYTASAIASICYNQLEAVVDGNVYRVLSRIFGISTPINSSAGQKQFKELAQQLIDSVRPGTFNQAVMEFGAKYCVPQNPDCGTCIFKNRCVAHKENHVAELPVKIKAKPVKHRYFNYLVILTKNESTILKQRNAKGIWQKLYEFPLVESANFVDLETLTEITQFKEFTKNIDLESISLYNEKPISHKLSHQHINTHFWILETSEATPESIPISEIQDYAVPVLIENFLSEFFENY